MIVARVGKKHGFESTGSNGTEGIQSCVGRRSINASDSVCEQSQVFFMPCGVQKCLSEVSMNTHVRSGVLIAASLRKLKRGECGGGEERFADGE